MAELVSKGGSKRAVDGTHLASQGQVVLSCREGIVVPCCPEVFNWPGLVDAFSHFAWPTLLLVVFMSLRKNIAKLIDRIRSVRAGKDGIQFEINEIESVISGLPPEKPQVLPEEKPQDKSDKSTDKQAPQEVSQIRDVNPVIKSVLEAAKQSPQLGIVTLSIELERELKALIASMGLLSQVSGLDLGAMLDKLSQRGALAPSITQSVKHFVQARNKIVHGGDIDPSQISWVTDLGLTILKAVYSIPCERHEVFETNVPLFSDMELKTSAPGKGLVLKTTKPSGTGFRFSIFPTTRAHFVVGKQVAWEWNMRMVWGKTWYFDKETNMPKEAWQSSAEFVGRHIQDL